MPKKKYFMSVKRLRDIEKGRVMPTMEEFFKLCFLYEIPETKLLEKTYPLLYKRWKKEIEYANKQSFIEENQENLVQSSPFIC